MTRTNGRPRVLELCVGGGGSALGFERAGFSPVALIDNNSHACATLRKNRPYWNIIEADIQRLDASYWKGVDLLSGGLPCPPFSIAGKQLGADDDRNLFPAMLRIVKEVRPRAIFIENVRGLFAPRFKGFRKEIDHALAAQGFDTQWAVFNAADFGVSQTRFRLFLVALRRGATKPLRWPSPIKTQPPTVGEAIGDLMGASKWRRLAAWIEGAAALAPTIIGGSEKHGGPDLGPTRARQQWAALGVDGLGIANEPPAYNFKGLPRLTLAMIRRLQGFPDDWEFSGPKTHAYRQIGNALPPALGESVAGAVKKCLA